MAQKYKDRGILRLAYFDIETTDFNPMFGYVLTIYMIVRDTQTNKIIKKKMYRVKQSEIEHSWKKAKENLCDERIITEFLLDLRNFDVDALAGYYSSGRHKFDMPFIRSRCLLMSIGVLIPTHKEIVYMDIWNMCKNSLKSDRYSLDKVGTITKATAAKTKVEGELWWLAQFGDKDSLDYVEHHNIKDVFRTMQVHKGVEKFNPIPATYV